VAGAPLYVCHGEEVPLTCAALASGVAAGPGLTFLLGAVGQRDERARWRCPEHAVAAWCALVKIGNAHGRSATPMSPGPRL
jgi:hypothetical protein